MIGAKDRFGARKQLKPCLRCKNVKIYDAAHGLVQGSTHSKRLSSCIQAQMKFDHEGACERIGNGQSS
eukprot:3406636-Pleurochrysis_carterae.AAC.1